ncbi:hypothetical protein VOLCADRAFT_118503 [Volvox carteri f. nagariensis]|uniref:Methyltransferase domain-containing protein n=1 Tax=Volvox carteri f. nagariensis TaxID=3068 RepID=D8U5G6_VOLCA|nr:uncharacterized protein VOLCADRAFT_118503 [Volvox carteri f. nagariensis]EFJ44916.1 hypothetical protein VOLCADRAFT_118503 [Volvox carteri f. nagariensis]|eukprot:XP_002953887.1 hypothetical protein VOLCADRAFT_118503 [Volvox carteri f. nagariensis]
MLLQATGGGLPSDDDDTPGGGGSGEGPGRDSRSGGRGPGGVIVLGAGSHRGPVNNRTGTSYRSRLAVRQWHLDSEQWHLAEDPVTDVLLALSVPAGWAPGPARDLTRALLDAFVTAHRPQLTALTAATTSATAATTSTAKSKPASPAPSPAPSQRPPALQLPPGGAVTLLTLQALKLLVRLAQEAMDNLTAAGLCPCWLYLVHVDSFMGDPPHTAAKHAAGGGGAGSSEAVAAPAGGGSIKKGKGRASALLRALLGAVSMKGFSKGKGQLGDVVGGKGGEDEGRGRGGGGGGGGSGVASKSKGMQPKTQPSAKAASGYQQQQQQQQQQEEEEEEGAGGGVGSKLRSVGPLQHLVLPPPSLRGNTKKCPQWDAATIALALLQVRQSTDDEEEEEEEEEGGLQGPGQPPSSQQPTSTSRSSGSAAAAGAAAGGPGGIEEMLVLRFRQLEDVELAMEVQLGGSQQPGGPQLFSVVSVRLGHVVAVVAQLAQGNGATDPGEVGGSGSISLFRSLLRPFLVPMSSLLHHLAHWALPGEVEGHGLLTTKRILVARSTSAYRDAIIHNVDRPDICLEIGCHEGLSSNVISNRATFVTGVDTAAEVVEIARRRHPHLAFHQLDGLAVTATRALSPTGTFSRICIDISGKAPLELICPMVTAQISAFPNAALIVKNEELFDALIAWEQEGMEKQDQQAAAAADQGAPVVDGAPALPPPSQTRDECKMMMRASAQRLQVHVQPKSQMQSQSQPMVPSNEGAGAADRSSTIQLDTAAISPSDNVTSGPQSALPATAAPARGADRTAPAAGTPFFAISSALTAPLHVEGAASTAGWDGGEGDCSRVSRLERLLGRALLAECEVFRHQSQLPRTRVRTRRGHAVVDMSPAPGQGHESGDDNAAERK